MMMTMICDDLLGATVDRQHVHQIEHENDDDEM